jgi:TonB family protein
MLYPWLAILLSTLAAAQTPVLRPGPGVVAPFVAAKPKPAYTDEARLARLEGSVLLSLVVASDGTTRDIHVSRSLGLGLDEIAVDNIRSWQFKPGAKDGVPVDVAVNEEVFFRPRRTLWDWHAVRAVFETPPGAMRPRLIKTKFPATVDTEENVSVAITFDVGTNGAPANLRVVKSSDRKWESQVLGAVREGWRFRAANREGRAVPARAWFEFVRGSHSPIPRPAIPGP